MTKQFTVLLVETSLGATDYYMSVTLSFLLVSCTSGTFSSSFPILHQMQVHVTERNASKVILNVPDIWYDRVYRGELFRQHLTLNELVWGSLILAQ